LRLGEEGASDPHVAGRNDLSEAECVDQHGRSAGGGREGSQTSMCRAMSTSLVMSTSLRGSSDLVEVLCVDGSVHSSVWRGVRYTRVACSASAGESVQCSPGTSAMMGLTGPFRQGACAPSALLPWHCCVHFLGANQAVSRAADC
jgi:hypothetical protein